MKDFWDINLGVQIDTALMLIVILLMYIAYKLSENGKRKTRSAKH